ncbi:hypothetical protein VTK56DRAFT_7054 [Thermocarpiscus australiensis]
MPRKAMSSPEKRRPPPGTGSAAAAKGTNGLSLGSPSRKPRSSANNTTSALIAPPPRAALSGASSPAPDNPRNNNNNNNNNNKEPAGNTASSSPPPPPPAAGVLPAAGTRSGSGSALGLDAATTTTTAHAALLRDKDARIAALERELALMESEFHRELDRLSQTESKTAAFWQAKCAALERRLAGGEAQAQAEAEAGARRDAEVAELMRAWEAAREALARRDEEIAALRAQVRGLKEWVSTSTRSDGQAHTSDEVFGEGMARLGNGLQNWVLVNFRRAKIDLASADEATVSELGRLVPMYEELVSTSKIHLLQSIVSRILVELVFDTYFVGLSSDMAGQLKQVETILSNFASSPEPINQWRSYTLTILKKDADEKMQTETSAVTAMVVSKVNGLLDSITNTKSTEARDQGLQALINSAIELSRLLAVQRAIFKVEMPEILPHQRILFDAETMEDIGGEDEESLVGREICCVTFPGLIKRGDESGGHLQYRNVISKARVLCSPERE